MVGGLLAGIVFKQVWRRASPGDRSDPPKALESGYGFKPILIADRGKTEVNEPILEEHGDVRRRFAELWNERTSGEAGAVDLAAAWQPVASMLEDHASAQDESADAVLPREGHDDTPEEALDSPPAEGERGVSGDFPEHSDETSLSRPAAQ